MKKIFVSNHSCGYMFPDFTLDEVVNGLNTLRQILVVGSQQLNESADGLGPHLPYLFNLILKTGIFPDEWKCAHITPIFKSSKVSYLSNYRPISILSPISKLFESLIFTKTMSYLEFNNLLHTPFAIFLPQKN